jgi:hypothetical protein
MKSFLITINVILYLFFFFFAIKTQSFSILKEHFSKIRILSFFSCSIQSEKLSFQHKNSFLFELEKSFEQSSRCWNVFETFKSDLNHENKQLIHIVIISAKTLKRASPCWNKLSYTFKHLSYIQIMKINNRFMLL